MAHVPAGTIIAGYRIEDVPGEGGMKVVYRSLPGSAGAVARARCWVDAREGTFEFWAQGVLVRRASFAWSSEDARMSQLSYG